MGATCKNNLLKVFTFALLIFAGCSGEVQVDSRLVDTFVELRLAELVYGADSPTARLVRQDVLKNSGYTRKEYIKKLDEILNDERQWVPFEKAVNARIDALLLIKKDSVAIAPLKEKNPKKVPPKTKKGVVDE